MKDPTTGVSIETSAEAPPPSKGRWSLSVDGQAIVLAALVAVAIFLGVVPGVPW